MNFVHSEFSTNKSILNYINELIREENKQDFYDLTVDEVNLLAALFFNADEDMAAESLVEGDTSNLYVAITNNMSGIMSADDLTKILREKIRFYYINQMTDLYEEQVSNWKCEVTHAAEQGGY